MAYLYLIIFDLIQCDFAKINKLMLRCDKICKKEEDIYEKNNKLFIKTLCWLFDNYDLEYCEFIKLLLYSSA